ncbi:MAG: glycosyltransferase family 4 protein [Cyanobacteria bacterium P01_C01_bin.120]
MYSARVAWLLPSAFFYWHPPLSHFAKHFPETKVFTGRWRGYAKGFEDAFAVDIVGDRKVYNLIPAETGYGFSFTYVSLNIVNKLIRFRPDVVFTNSFGVWTIVALFLKPFMKWRVVLAYEGSSPSVDFRDSPRRLAIRRFMTSQADALISNSHEGKDYLIQCLGVDEKQMFVQPYEVPAPEAMSANPVAVTAPDVVWQPPIFLYVGQIIPRKGLNLLLDACKVLKQRGCNHFTLVIVGDGKQRSELETYAEKLDIATHIQWTGRVDYACLGSYFAAANTFILPTLEDTWGMVVLEAMTLGKSVICSKFAGASELIVEGENGYVVNPQNAEDLATAMQHFVEDPDLGDRLGKGAAHYITQHSPEAAGEFLTKIADFVLQR